MATELHLTPKELHLHESGALLKVSRYADCPELREVVMHGLYALVEEHHRSVFGNQCGRCGNSCRRPEILVREQEILDLQQHLGLSELAFRAEYLQETSDTWNPGDGFMRLRNGACPFLEPGSPAIPHSATCQIYSQRPQACRDFRSDASFCRKDSGRLIESVLALHVTPTGSHMVLIDGSLHQLPTNPDWWAALLDVAGRADQSDPNRFRTILESALAILARLEAGPITEEKRATLDDMEKLLRSAADLSHLQPSLCDQLEQGWTRLHQLYERLDRGDQEPAPPAPVVLPRPAGLEWLYLVEAGLTLQVDGVPRVHEFRSQKELQRLAWHLLDRILNRPEELLQQSLQEVEPSCTMCGECCRFYSVEIQPSDIHRLCQLLRISPAEFVERHTVEAKFNWNRDSRVLRKVPTPLYSKALRELQLIPAAQGMQCGFLERRDDGFFYCGVHSHKPQICIDYKATAALCRKTNQLPNPGRQAHSVRWIHLGPDALQIQTARGLEAQLDPMWIARGFWPEVEEAAQALEQAAVAL